MKILNTIMFLLLLTVYTSSGSEAASPLQSRVDDSPEGATIEIEQGEYEETLVISKPVILEGKGKVVLRSCQAGPVITLNGEAITLKNIKVQHCGDEQEDTAIYVTGSRHNLEELDIETKRFGIKLDQANNVTIRNSKIVGQKRGNGIDVWKSNGNKFENLSINNVLDGIYFEQSNKNISSRNEIQRSRYGMHFMFSNDNVLSENLFRFNTTGTMLMGSKRTSIRNNVFHSNRSSVNAQGLLIYAASETEVIENEFISNRIGIYIEEAENNRMDSNKIMNNFIGVQFQKATENTIVRNTFVGNVNDAQAIDSSNNEVDGNYWDAASKVDSDGDGRSDIIFSADPYFLTLTNAIPELQLFFQAPGLILLQNMLKSPPEQLLTDSAPLMQITMEIEKETSTKLGLWMISVVMILASSSLFILGRKRE